MIDPKGPAAARVAELWWVLLAMAALILTGVVGVAVYALRRNRRDPRFSERGVLIGWGLVFPLATLLALMGFAFLRGEQLLTASPGSHRVIEAHARQWNWTFEYPGGARTLDVLHVSAGETFHVKVSSEDVIHSFWVPTLGGKIDAIPGKENWIALQADRPGVYLGTCAEYCGIGHAHMQLEVHAHAPAEYADALATAAERKDLPILVPREAPAATVIQSWIEYLLEWIGAK